MKRRGGYGLILLIMIVSVLILGAHHSSAQGQVGEIPPFSSSGYNNWEVAFTSDRDGNLEVYAMNADGSNVRRLTDNPASDSTPKWSPDGSQIAFVSDRDGNLEIYVMNADGSNPRNLTNNPASDGTPAWAPGGSQIVFASDRDGNAELYVMNADGSNPRNLTNNPASDGTPAWSPDGSRIAFVSSRGGSGSELYMMDSNGGSVRQITNSDGTNIWYPAWSPDNSRMSITAERNNSAILDVMNPDGGDFRQLTQQGDRVTLTDWSPDSQFIAYMSARTGNANLYAMNVDSGRVFWLTDDPFSDTEPDWKPLGGGPAPSSCAVRTDRSDVPLRVGPGLNRSEYSYLTPNQDYAVTGQYTDETGAVWYELDKNQFGAADTVNSLWVAQSDVMAGGNCAAVPPTEPSPFIPSEQQPTPSNTWGQCGSCDTCGHTYSECQLDPTGECVWNPETCAYTPPSEGTETPQASCYQVATAANPSSLGSVSLLTARNCGEFFQDGTVVQVQATLIIPRAIFTGWSGTCGATGTANPVSVTVHSNCSVIGNFSLGG
jgi:Tol biopolymer transport system component